MWCAGEVVEEGRGIWETRTSVDHHLFVMLASLFLFHVSLYLFFSLFNYEYYLPEVFVGILVEALHYTSSFGLRLKNLFVFDGSEDRSAPFTLDVFRSYSMVKL